MRTIKLTGLLVIAVVLAAAAFLATKNKEVDSSDLKIEVFTVTATKPCDGKLATNCVSTGIDWDGFRAERLAAITRN